MTNEKLTLGQAIDRIIDILNALDPEARKTAVSAACSHLDIKIEGEQVSVEAVREVTVDKEKKRIDIRTLKEQKKPVSAKQMACVVAYYLQELADEKEKKTAISTKDIETYFKQAGFRLPEALGQVLRNAKASGYFDSVGSGKFKLNAVGYNLVAHGLPEKREHK
jgi:hypothetical protein